MSDVTRRGISILAAALALGTLGDALLRAWPWGLNLAVWVAALVIVTIALSRLTADGAAANASDRVMVIPVLFFATAVAWRDSTVLLCLNLLALGVSLSLIPLYSKSERLVRASLLDYSFGTMMVWLSTSIGPLVLALDDIHWSEIKGTGRFAQAPAVVRGIILAVPPLLVFGALFVSADAAFDRLVRTIIRIDVDAMIIHGTIIVAIAWLVAGWARHMLHEQAWDNPASRLESPFGLGMVEMGIVLGALDLLFFAFIVIQVGYLFGGATFVEASRDFTYAEYARRGFFELVWVAALSLSFLLLARWVARPTSTRGEHGFVTLTIVFIGLLYVIMISALSRMALYTSLFGLTELRLYPTAFMGWLAVVFAWFVATALRGKPQHFAIGALVAGFVTIGVLNAINPDGLIVRTNFGRVGAPQPLDTGYLSSLSSDAVPALLEGLPTLPAPEQQRLRTIMATRWLATEPDWRTLNWSRGRAAAALKIEPATNAAYRQENS